MKKFAGLLAIAVALIFAAPAIAADNAKTHRIAIQVDQNDPALMNLVLNNVSNLMEYYHSKGEQAQIEVVAYGPGLNMFRDDKSPVKERLAEAKKEIPGIVYSMCGNAKAAAEKREGHEVVPIEGVGVVPAGIVRVAELEEQGWVYIRP